MKRIITILLVFMPLFSAAQYWLPMVQRIFNCAPGWTKEGPVSEENLAYEINCFCECGAYSKSNVYYRFGKDSDHSLHIYYDAQAGSGYLRGTMFYVGEAIDCWHPSGSGGRCYASNGKLLYEGEYEAGTGKPLGTYPVSYSSNKRFEAIWDGSNLYIGETVNGVKHGWGLYIWSNGECLFGEWRNGSKCGFGMKKLNNGCSCVSSENWTDVNYTPRNMD